MPTGGIFQIINNDSKQEKIIYGTEVLNQRLLEVAQGRAEMGMDPVPTLADVEETHYLLTNAHFKPIVAIAIEYTRTNSNGTNNFNSTIQLPIMYFGDFYHDMCIHMVVDAPTVTVTTAPTGSEVPGVRFCDYPGERICQEVSFNVNGNVLDKYVAEDYVMFRQFKLQPNKKIAYDRCMGQEVPEEAYSDDATDAVRRWKIQVADGAQTPKAGGSQAALELYIPLLFWFNTDVRLAIPAVSIPNGDRRIELKTCTEAQLVQHQERSDTGSPVSAVDSLNISTCELIVNNLFVNNEIHDIYIDQVGFSLIRVHLRHTTRLSVASNEILLNNIKWPIEVLYVGARPTVNVTALGSAAAVWAFRDLEIWHRFASVSRADYDAAGGDTFYSLKHAVTLDTLEVTAYGVTIYTNFGTGFYNAYIPFTYGGNNINSPTDTGLNMITFCLYPGTYQVSSHLNTSRAREFYLKYTSSVIDGSNEADLYVAADALNFALLSDGSLVLRYYT